jgi:acetoin utilization deacetylase AcuC-like enzyme
MGLSRIGASCCANHFPFLTRHLICFWFIGMPTGFITHPECLAHDTGAMHPESAERLRYTLNALQGSELWPRLNHLVPPPATLEDLQLVHPATYIARIQRACDGSQPLLDNDTVVCPRSFTASCHAIGAALHACDQVMAGQVHNAFCAIRPPGHHAEGAKAMGFCLFNNIAIAARHLQVRHGLQRVLIVDWDVHHGNGTQDIFYRDPSVFFFSIHQHPLYPGTGAWNEAGEGPGLGTTLNVPLPSGSGDMAYFDAFELELAPAVARFKPDFILISAGFDAHENDPLAGMRVTDSGFAVLTRMVRHLAEEHCQGRLVSLLEGGYRLSGLSHGIMAHLSALLDRE